MRLVVDQPIDAPPDRVQAALLDHELYERLSGVSPIGAPEVLANERDGDRVTQRIRLRFTGQLDRRAARVVDPAKLSWVQETVTDLRRRRTELRTIPDQYGRLLSMQGWYELRPDGVDRTVQHLECDLRVHVPAVGWLAERGIARGLKQHLAKEAAILEHWPDA